MAENFPPSFLVGFGKKGHIIRIKEGKWLSLPPSPPYANSQLIATRAYYCQTIQNQESDE